MTLDFNRALIIACSVVFTLVIIAGVKTHREDRKAFLDQCVSDGFTATDCEYKWRMMTKTDTVRVIQ